MASAALRRAATAHLALSCLGCLLMQAPYHQGKQPWQIHDVQARHERADTRAGCLIGAQVADPKHKGFLPVELLPYPSQEPCLQTSRATVGRSGRDGACVLWAGESAALVRMIEERAHRPTAACGSGHRIDDCVQLVSLFVADHEIRSDASGGKQNHGDEDHELRGPREGRIAGPRQQCGPVTVAACAAS